MLLFKPKNNKKTLEDSFIKKITGEIYSEEEFKSIIVKERARADRTDHHFSLILFDLGFNNGAQNKNGALLQKIISRIRRIDEIGWYDTKRIGILLPYTSERGAQRFTENLCQLLNPALVACIFKVYTYDIDKIDTE